MTVIECDELPEEFENAKIIAANGTAYGAKAEIVCPVGFRNTGPRHITCLPTGQWSAPLSPCARGERSDSTIEPRAATDFPFLIADVKTSLPPATVTQSVTPGKPSRTSARYTTTIAPTTYAVEGKHLNSEMFERLLRICFPSRRRGH